MVDKPQTHRDLLPKDVCPSFMIKHIATHSLDDPIFDHRGYAGDGYAWCMRTCRNVGPDDELVEAETCRPSRPCYDAPQG